MKLERLLSIIFKLLHNEILSASSLADEFQVSTRTIYRDIEAICAAGIPVVSYQGANGGFEIMRGYKFDKSLIGSHDVLNLITVLSSLSSVFEDKEVEHTIDRLKSLDTSESSRTLYVNLESLRTEPNSLIRLRKAIQEKRQYALIMSVIKMNLHHVKQNLSTFIISFVIGMYMASAENVKMIENLEYHV